MSKGAPGVRFAEIDRETKETRVNIVLDLDGGTKQDISTGVGFFDHMLTLMAFHGQLDVGIKAEGDLNVDDHHTVEDVGIVLGKAIRQSLAESEPVVRYADNHTAMDEALVLIAIDMSGRGSLHYEVHFEKHYLGELSTECVEEFFKALAYNSGMNIHIHQIAGHNDHHICEAIFKGVGRALYVATRNSERRVHASTKGKLD
jgi:imidazoleglycerol-phosphate dehydratase